MTPDKYQREHQPALRSTKCEAGCPLEDRVKGIEANVSDIKGIVTGMYDKVEKLAETTDTIYDMVSYHQNSAGYNHTSDDFLDDLEE